jgi:hypothetical protein
MSVLARTSTANARAVQQKNFSVLNRIALHLLKQEKTSMRGIR